MPFVPQAVIQSDQRLNGAKITELRQLKHQRADIDEKIKALTDEVKAEMKAFLKKGKQK